MIAAILSLSTNQAKSSFERTAADAGRDSEARQGDQGQLVTAGRAASAALPAFEALFFSQRLELPESTPHSKISPELSAAFATLCCRRIEGFDGCHGLVFQICPVSVSSRAYPCRQSCIFSPSLRHRRSSPPSLPQLPCVL